jgi:glycine oxidase
MVGATVIESEDTSPMTARSALELLGLAYALHPSFGEAEIIEMGVGLRPSFPDNVPKVVVRGDRLYVNGAYRHGFLLAPLLADAAANYLESGVRLAGIVIDG